MNSSKAWQYRIFAVTWVSYAALYLCRKNLSVVMPLLKTQPDYNGFDLAHLIFAYSAFYACGQFIMGSLSDRLGPRLVVASGMILSAWATAGMGFAYTGSALLWLQMLNGLGQATGWSGLVKIMACWFDRRERGVVMSWWGTNLIVGGLFATIFATFWATNSWLLPKLGWQRAMFAPALLLGAVAVVFAVVSRNKPSDAGFLDRADVRPASQTESAARWREVLRNPVIHSIAAAYFFIKLTRYAFLFWLPLYMTEQLHYGAGEAGYTSSIYELVGFSGAIIAGYVSDKLFESRRFPVAALMLFGLGMACLAHPSLAAFGRWGNIVGIGLIGILTFGPDTILAGAAVQDAGTTEAAATAAGYVNGVGSIGQLLSPYVVSLAVGSAGWDSLFYLFTLMAAIGGIVLTFRWSEGKMPLPAAAVRAS